MRATCAFKFGRMAAPQERPALIENVLTLGTLVSDEKLATLGGFSDQPLMPWWNAFGFDGSQNYSLEGQWMRPAET